MDYHDQPLQYINRYYFRIKTNDDENYNIIFTIMIFMLAIQIAISFGVTVVAIRNIFPIIVRLLMKFSSIKFNEDEIKNLIEKLSKSETEDNCVEPLMKNDQQNVIFVQVMASSDHASKLSDMQKKMQMT